MQLKCIHLHKNIIAFVMCTCTRPQTTHIYSHTCTIKKMEKIRGNGTVKIFLEGKKRKLNEKESIYRLKYLCVKFKIKSVRQTSPVKIILLHPLS